MQNAGQLTGDHWRSQQNFKAVRSQVSQIQLSKISSDMLLTAERTLNRLDVTVFRPWSEDVNTLSCSPQLVGQLFKSLMLESCGQNIFMISSCVLLHKNIMLKCGHLDVHCVSWKTDRICPVFKGQRKLSYPLLSWCRRTLQLSRPGGNSCEQEFPSSLFPPSAWFLHDVILSVGGLVKELHFWSLFILQDNRAGFVRYCICAGNTCPWLYSGISTDCSMLWCHYISHCLSFAG